MPRKHKETTLAFPLSYSLTLTLPPSINAYWRMRIYRKGQPNGKKSAIPIKYVTHVGKAYKREIEDDILDQYPDLVPLEGPLEASIDVYPKTKREEDIDNRLKPLFDALEGILYENDSQLKQIHVTMHAAEPPGSLCITIGEQVT